ncbi:efflux transporter outer membrane subunit [Acinetobacter sp.]|uniref:efflux transporter outer membrane subunit n=1 Tax=Acinetobacter sp. TaxID=472 RepID=UPI00388D7EB3
MLKLNIFRRFYLGSSLVALPILVPLTGCQNTVPLTKPEPALPAHYPFQQSGAYHALPWSDYVSDPTLVRIARLALTYNHDLKIAALRIREAQAAYGIQRSELWPGISGSSSYERSRVPADLSPVGRAVTTEQYTVGVGTSQWELDLWGRIRSLNEAALQQFFASEYNQLAVRNSIIQQSIQTYLTLSELEKRIYFAERSVESYERSVHIFKRRYEVGAGSKVEYMQAQTLLSNGRALLTQLQNVQDTTANYLIQLIGQPVEVPRLGLDQLNFKPVVLQTGLPSELLLNRPDIRAAEALLYSQHANIQAARAAFFPRIALTGSFGTASTELDGLFKSGSSVWSIAPSISLPIFTAGRLKNNVILAEVRQDITVADYEKTVQNAFREVADALVDQRYLSQQLQIQNQGLAAFRETARLAQLRYDNGAVGYLDVLDAQRSLLSAEQQSIETQSALMQSYISLYFALGGDSRLAQPG